MSAVNIAVGRFLKIYRIVNQWQLARGRGNNVSEWKRFNSETVNTICSLETTHCHRNGKFLQAVFANSKMLCTCAGLG